MNGFLKNLRIRTKILLMSCLIIVISNMSTSIAYFYLADSLKTKTYEYSAGIAEQAIGNLDLFFDDLEMQAFSICANPDLQQFILQNRNYSEYDYQKQYTSVSRIFALITIPKDYMQIHMFSDYMRMPMWTRSAGMWLNTDYDFHADEWYRRLNDGGLNRVIETGSVQNYFLDRTRSDVVTYAVRILSLGQLDTIGYLLIDIKKEYFRKCISRDSPDVPDIIIIDENGRMIYHTSERGSDPEEVLSHVPDRPSGRFEASIGGRSSLVVYNGSKHTGWKVITVIPSDTLLSDYRILPLIFAAILVSTVAVTAFLSYLIARNITNPIEKLITDMKQAKTGRFPLPLPVHSNDECGALIQNYNDMMHEIDDLMRRNRSMALLKKEAELKALQQQLNPHFINNTLEIMIGLACEGDIESVITICKSLGRMLSYNLHGGHFVTVWEEVEHIRNYLRILENRLPGRFTTRYRVNPDIREAKMLKFVIQPFVENSIIHGFADTMSGGLLTIDINMEGDRLRIVIEDNGCGMPEEDIARAMEIPDDYTGGAGMRIGIRNVFCRLKLHYGAQAGFDIDSRPGAGVRVTIRFPLLM